MITPIVKQETQTIVKNVISEAYNGLAESFSFVLKEDVGIDHVNVYFTTKADLLKKLPETGNIVAVQTDIIGEFTGTSFLIVNQQEMNLVCAKARKSIHGNFAITDGDVIKEVDNILAASFITRLSEGFSIEIFGDVPLLIPKKEAYSYDKIFDRPVVWSIGYLKIIDKDYFNPGFICIMNESFIIMAGK